MKFHIVISKISSPLICNYRDKHFLNLYFQALDSGMQSTFEKVSAAVKGYLTRRLLRTQKVQDLIKTIRVGIL